MAMITVSDLTFGYDGSRDTVFEHASFRIDTDWKLGFTGRNGRGKTTFLNLLMGKYEYRGTISPPLACDYFPFDVPDKSESTLDAVTPLCGGAPPWKLLRELNLLRVPEDALYRPFETLSSGERTKVLLAALFLNDTRYLLIDEPTNHLDREARALVSAYLNRKKGFLLVSHDRAFLDGCVDHILAVNRTGFEVRKGNFSSWWKNRALRDQFEADENEKLRKEIRGLEEAAKRTAAWSDRTEKSKLGGGVPDRGFVGHRAAKLMKRSKSAQTRRERAAEQKATLLRDTEQAEPLALHPAEYPKRVLAEARGLFVRYGGRAVCEPVDFLLRRGDRIALTGTNGCGKSSLLSLVCGAPLDFGGTLSVGSNLVVSRVPQDTSFLRGSLWAFAAEHGLDESLFLAILRKLDFSRGQFEKDMGEFSGGQKKKVLIAKSLCERAHLYVWDEPLNFVDVLSRIQIETLLKEYRPTMLFVEHDRAFTDAVATGQVPVSREKQPHKPL